MTVELRSTPALAFSSRATIDDGPGEQMGGKRGPVEQVERVASIRFAFHFVHFLFNDRDRGWSEWRERKRTKCQHQN